MMKPKFLPALFILLITASCSLPLAGGKGNNAPASGSLLFQDDFSQPGSGWDHVVADGGMMDYDNGVYRFLIDTPHFNYWSTPAGIYSDSRVEVDVARLEGPDSNRAGIICRLSGEQFYFFVISSDGYYAVGRTNGLESVLLGQEQMQSSNNINTGMALNHLRADCIGDQLTVYINGFPVAKVTDGTLASGEVGLLAGTFDEGGVDIIFDQFILMQP
jgi:hypothetical protein